MHQLYGAELTGPAGIIHVTALWQSPSGVPRVLRVNQATPRSASDLFALCLARARADAIVTTGEILRHEPGLVHRIPTTAPELADLGEWRAERLGRPTPPLSVVLSSGRGLDLLHPLFQSGPCLVYTGDEGTASLASAAGERGVMLKANTNPSLRQVLRFLREERGCETVSIEAGPSTVRELYSDPLAIDELMLSVS